MFRIRNKKKVEKQKDYDKRVSELAYMTVRDALETILKTEIKKTNTDGKEVVDCGLTISKIKMTARTALEFVDNLKTVETGNNKT